MREFLFAVAFAVSAGFLCGQVEDIEPPWGTVHASITGTASTEAIPYLWGEGPVREAWRLDVRGAGYDRVAGRNPISFDADGNIYWKTSIGGGTGGRARVVSVSTEGTIRWSGNDGQGNPHDLGAFFDGTGVVVGTQAAYALGGTDSGAVFVAAYDKNTGALLWESELDESTTAARDVGGIMMADLLTPVLYAGKLYVVAPDIASFYPRNVYRIDVQSGDLDWISTIEEITISFTGSITLVPDAFGAGQHGLYFNGESGAGNDGIPDVFGVRAAEEGAELGWSAEGGKVARSHLIYSAETNTLYAHTWTDYGGTLYTYDPVEGLLAINTNPAGTGHGFYDVGCLDFSGTDIIAGGFEGMVVRYTDEGNGVATAQIAFDDGMASPTFWGEYRVYGQLLKAPNGHSVLISGTNSDTDANPGFTARVVAIDVTEGRLLWEFDTGVVQNHGFTVRGGPVAGPDGKIYYFDAVTGELVALTGPEMPRPPQFTRGDANADGQRNIADAISVLSHLFGDGEDLPCEDAADANDDGGLDIADAVKVLSHLFAGTGPLPDPFDSCGRDPEDGDELGCLSFPPCGTR